MALAFTVTNHRRVPHQYNEKIRVDGTIAFDSSFLATGEAFLPSMIGLKTITHMEISPFGDGTDHYSATADLSNNKIYAFYQDGDSGAFPIASGANLAAFTAVPFFAEGAST